MNRVSSEAPSTISGVVSGSTRKMSTNPLPRNRYFERANAIIDPMIVASVTEIAATFRLLPKAVVSSGSAKGWIQLSSVN